MLTYTTFGGMFSVAILDFVQITIIMGGMLYIASVISGLTGGVGAVCRLSPHPLAPSGLNRPEKLFERIFRNETKGRRLR